MRTIIETPFYWAAWAVGGVALFLLFLVVSVGRLADATAEAILDGMADWTNERQRRK